MRFTDHDGLSFFVLEALSRGKQVIYRNNFPFCLHAKTEDELVHHLEGIYEMYKQHKDISNLEGARFVRENYNKEKVLNSLVKKLKSVYAN